jgi:hypothetical protein
MTAASQVAVQWMKEKAVAQSLVAKPQEPTQEGAVVRWEKSWSDGDGNDGYQYAAIHDGDGTWYTTQDPRRTGKNKILPSTWDELLEKIGQHNWDTLELLD